jgi:hypothetical protein
MTDEGKRAEDSRGKQRAESIHITKMDVMVGGLNMLVVWKNMYEDCGAIHYRYRRRSEELGEWPGRMKNAKGKNWRRKSDVRS